MADVSSTGTNYTQGRNPLDLPSLEVDPMAMMQGHMAVQQMQALNKAPLTPDLKNSSFFPEQRGIQVGATSSQTLGSQPIFAAGTGLMPFEVLQAYRIKKAERDMLQYAPKDLDTTLPEISPLQNIHANPVWQEFVKAGTDTWLNTYMSSLGDPGSAYKALRTDRNFQKWVKDLNQISSDYNMVIGEANSILELSTDPTNGITPEQSNAAMTFINEVEGSLGETVDPNRLTDNIEAFKSKVSIFKIGDAVTANLGDRITQRIADITSTYSTDKRKAYQEIEKKGLAVMEEAEINDMMEMAINASSFPLNDKQKKDLKTYIRSKIDNVTKSTLKSLATDLASAKISLRGAGVPMDENGSIQFTTGTAIYQTRTNQYGQRENVGVHEVIGFPGKMAKDKTIVLPANQRITVVAPDGTKREVLLQEPTNFLMSREYNVTETVNVETAYGPAAGTTTEDGEDVTMKRASSGLRTIKRVVEGFSQFTVSGVQSVTDSNDNVTGKKTVSGVSFIDPVTGDQGVIGSDMYVIVNQEDVGDLQEGLIPGWNSEQASQARAAGNQRVSKHNQVTQNALNEAKESGATVRTSSNKPTPGTQANPAKVNSMEEAVDKYPVGTYVVMPDGKAYIVQENPNPKKKKK